MAKLIIETELDYELGGPTDLLLQVEAASLPEQRIEQADIQLPQTDHFARVPGHDAIGERIWLRLCDRLTVNYRAAIETDRITADIAQLPAVPPHLLPAETVDYLMPSRYCPSDQFQSLVEDEFGGTAGGARVAAITAWIAQHIAYVPGSSDPTTTAMETYIERKGVCRDFAHLTIALLRASVIPARFVSVYGVGVVPQDFHAVPEVFLDNTWYLLDPTGMATAQHMAKIGVGRDAADVSFITSYGAATLERQEISVSAV